MRSSTVTLLVIAGVLVGAVLGVVATWWASPPPPEASAGEDASAPEREASETPRTRSEPLSATRTEDAPPGPDPEPSSETPSTLFSPALLEYAREGLRAGWQQVRSDEMPEAILAEAMQDFQESVRVLPSSMGQRLGREQSTREAALEDARTGGVLALLERLDDRAGPVLGLVSSPEDFEPLFQRVGPESVVDGTAATRSREAAPDGTTLSFPPGVFRVDNFTQQWSRRRELPRDLTVSGAGIDSTLLVLRSSLRSSSSIRNLRWRDCTLFTDNNYAFDVRHSGSVLRFDRVRLCGFDMGAGASCAFGTDTLALHCVDCHLVGGYGRHPQYGLLFDVRTDGLLARFDRCTIEAVAIGTLRSRATVLFSGCDLIDVFEDPVKLAEEHDGVQLDQCRVQVFAGDHNARSRELKRDLEDLFPDWRERMK